MKKLLIADDAEINREILSVIFDSTFDIICANDGEQAIEQITKHKDNLSIILLDNIMPKKSGIDVLKFMNDNHLIDEIPVIMITGESTVESDIRAYELGAADIIYKPFSKKVIMRRVFNINELYEHRRDIEKQLEERTKELSETYKKIEKNNEFLIKALGSVVEFRSLESGEHVARVQNLSRIMLNNWVKLHPESQFTQTDIDQMSNASALHDIGKIAIPDNVLMKPGRLTSEEFEVMKTHTVRGCEILLNFKQEDSDFYQYCYDICRYHHERYDGKGYPDQLKGDEIPLWAQVVSVVDVYDALISPRVYKAAYSIDEAFRMIYAGECGCFSPEVLECLEVSKEEIIQKSMQNK